MSDFLVNYLFPDGVQENPHIQALPGGRFAIAWEDAHLDKGYERVAPWTGVYMKVYGTDGAEIGDGDPDTFEFNRVADEARGMQFGGLMAPAPGGLVIAYESDAGDLYADDNSWDVFLQFYDRDGDELGGNLGSNNIQVTPRSSEDHRLQDVETLEDGTVVVLTARSPVRFDWTLEAWHYAADGTFLGSRVLNEETHTGYVGVRMPDAQATALPDGGYLMTWWQDPDERGYRYSIHAQSFEADGVARGPVRVISPQAYEIGPGSPFDDDDVRNDHRTPVTVPRGDGTSVVYWNTDYEDDPDVLLSRVVDAAGRPIGPVRTAVENAGLFVPDDVLALPNGWALMSYGVPLNGGLSIELALFDPSGREAGRTIYGSEYVYSGARESSLALADDGTLGLAFQGVDVDGLDILARFRPVADVLGEALGRDGPVRPEDLPPPDADVPPGHGAPGTGTSGPDRLEGTGAADVLAGRGGADVILGLGGADVLRGGAGADRLLGGAGRDRLDGGAGRDTLLGGKGADRLDGGGGRDVLKGGSGRDVLDGGRGADRLDGGGGRDRLEGGGGRDALTGGRGADRLDGGGGRDVLKGGGGRDVLDGGRGADRMTGGGGPDVFVFGRGDGRDVVTDFRAADTLRLDDVLWGGRDLSAGQVVRRFADDAGPDVVLRFGDGDALRLKGVAEKESLLDDLVIV